MRLLELFSGTGSVGKAFREKGWDVVSVDVDSKMQPTICCDVRELDWLELPPIDCVWASPVCQHYSVARTRGGPRNLEAADELVRAALRIVEALDVPFFLENPHSGLLKSRPFMQELLPPKVVDYCMFGHPYRKRTAIWTNTSWEPSRPLCRHDCPASDGRRHLQTAQRGLSSGCRTDASHSLKQLYSIPPALCEEIAAFMTPASTSPAAQTP